MYDVIKNACEEEKVPFLPLDVVKTFKTRQKLSEEAVSVQGKKLFYEVILRVNDLVKKKSKRLTETELRIASWIIDEIIKNGQIDEDRERYEALLNKIVSAEAMNDRSWNQMRKNLRDKGFFRNENKRYSILVEDILIKTLSKGSLNVLIY